MPPDLTPELGRGACRIQADWHTLEAPAEPPLRCWWARPQAGEPRAGILVLPEVFGVNGWVRSVADRLASQGYAALVMPLFARTAPDLELGYGPDDLQEGRSHKERTTTASLLADCRRAVAWLQGAVPGPVGCVGFCFGGHVAMLAATLPAVAVTCDFYGAGVVSGRPGGGPPTLDLLPEVAGQLLCFCGDRDPLIPETDGAAIAAALEQANRRQGRHEPTAHGFIRLAAGHGFLCEARADFDAEAARQGWDRMAAAFATGLGRGAGGMNPGD